MMMMINLRYLCVVSNSVGEESVETVLTVTGRKLYNNHLKY